MGKPIIIFQWFVLFFLLILIVVGFLNFRQSSQDYEMNLILIGILTILIAAILVFFMIYILKTNPNDISWIYASSVNIIIVFGIIVGTISVSNGIDTSRFNELRSKLGWIIGSTTTLIGITGIIWTLIALLRTYQIKPFAQI